MPVNQSLRRRDPVLEGLKKTNSSFIHMNRYASSLHHSVVVHKSTNLKDTERQQDKCGLLIINNSLVVSLNIS